MLLISSGQCEFQGERHGGFVFSPLKDFAELCYWEQYDIQPDNYSPLALSAKI